MTSQARNAYFDDLFERRGLRAMGQNTNHIELPAAVREAMLESIDSDEFRGYAPPLGLEKLRAAVVEDIGLAGASAMITDGGVEALYNIAHTFLRPGDEMVTTDPGWKWPPLFARAIGAEVIEIPIYDAAYGYRLTAERLTERLSERTRVIYLVDPNNPLGTCIEPREIERIAALARERRALIVHDCTYRHFAERHTLAAHYYPEGTLTIYSFSKWLGLAGLRLGAVIGMPEMIERLAAAAPNTLGSNVVAQRAAVAGLLAAPTWFPGVQALQRRNQARVKVAADAIDGLHLPVYPSEGNFVVMECIDAGIRPEALVVAMQARKILIRQGTYHTQRFGHRFVKVSTTVPAEWADEFCALLPEAVVAARNAAPTPTLF